MRKILAMAGAFILTGSICYGQDATPDLSAGSQALLFSFNGLSVISAGTFDGGAGYKYFISDGTAVRGSVMLAKASASLPANPVAPATGIDGSQDARTIGFSAALEHHMGMGRVSPYIGAGASFSTTSTEAKNVVVGNPPGAQTTTKNRAIGETINASTYQAGNTVGFFGHMGFEFFLKKEVSLAGEYRLGYSRTSFKDQQVITGATTTTTRAGDSSLFGISSQGLLTLAVYF